MELVNLHFSRRNLHPEGHLRPECHLHHQLTWMDTIVMKSDVSHPGVCIYILHFQTLNFSIIIHMPRIASVIKILFQIC